MPHRVIEQAILHLCEAQELHSMVVRKTLVNKKAFKKQSSV